MKTEACSSQETAGLFYGAHPNKVMKLVVFISKPLSRIAKKDSTTNATLSVPNKQNDNSEVDQNEEKKALEKTQHQSSPKDHVRTKSKSFIKKSRFFHTYNRWRSVVIVAKGNLLDSINPTRIGLVMATNTQLDNRLFTNLLKNQISELKNS